MRASSSRLTPLQRELLAAFAASEPRFVLTGGAALVGYHLYHRQTKDLDLFSSDAGVDLDMVGMALEQAAGALGAELTLLQSYPRFRRYEAVRAEETTLVDLVLDATPRVAPPEIIDGVRVDTMVEIAANKLCTLIGRAEIRDLVDLLALLDAGIRVEEALDAARTKEGGVDAATLGWILDEIYIGEDAVVPGELDAKGLDERRQQLVKLLRRMAFPKNGR